MLRRRARLLRCIVLASLLAPSACAEPPNKELDQAQGAIEAARAAGADQFAAEEIKAAADSLTRAHTAVEQRDYRQALSLALDAKERARDAARTGAERMAQLRSDAERAIDAAGRAVGIAAQRLGGAEGARVPAAQREAMHAGLKGAEKSLQEARTAFEQQAYGQAKASADAALVQVRDSMTTAGDAARRKSP